jgi:hypothetical protein
MKIILGGVFDSVRLFHATRYNFSITRILNNVILDWMFQGSASRKPKYLRALSARRHPVRAIAAGPK